MATLLFFSILLVVTDRIKKQKEDEAASVSSSSWENPYDDEEIDPVVYFGGKPYVHKKNLENVLFMGIDTEGEVKAEEGYRNHQQVDVLMLCVIDHQAKNYQVIQINRDTITRIRTIDTTGDRLGTIDTQIALAHTYGSGMEDSCEYTCEAVSMLLQNEEIDHYVSLNMSSIAILNKSVGGIEVTVPVDMTSVDPALTEGTTLLLNDEQAEHFIRGRMTLEDDRNSSRMERQEAYLHAWRLKAKEKMNADAAFALDLIADLSYYMVADQNLNGLSTLSGYLADYEYLGKVSIEGETKMGEVYREFYPDQDALKQLVMDIFYEEKPQ